MLFPRMDQKAIADPYCSIVRMLSQYGVVSIIMAAVSYLILGQE